MPKYSFLRKLLHPFIITAVYILVSEFGFIALITVVTSLVVPQNPTQEQLNQINDTTGQYMYLIYALSALAIFLLGRAGDKALGRKHNFWPTSGKYIWSLGPEARSEILRGIGSGLLIPLIIISLLIFSGQLQYHGIFVLSDISSPIFLLFLTNVFSILTLVSCEEYIFRYKVLSGLQKSFRPITSVALTSIVYVIVKAFQFNLSPEDHVSLFLLNFSAGFYFLRTMRVFRGLTFLVTLYGMIHLVCGLPMLGQKGVGIFLIMDSTVAFRSVTGGGLGPLSGVAFISVLLLVAGTSGVLWQRNNASR